MHKILIALVCLGVVVSFASQTAQPAEDAYRDATQIDEQMLKQRDLQRAKAPTYQVPAGYPDFGGRAWLIAEDFEAGMPGDWTIVDQNGDAVTWTTGTTTDLHAYEPPGYGTAYAFYSDDDAYPSTIGNEYLISPAKYCGTYLGMEFDYSFGYDHLSTYAWFTVEARFHDGSTWGSWIQLAYYGGSVTNDTLGIQKFSFTPYLPADSVQVQFVWNEPGPYTTWSWGCGVDNVFVGTPADHDVACVGVVSPPEGLISAGDYAVTGHIQNNGMYAESFWLHGTVYDTDGMVVIFDDSTYVSGFAVGGDQNVTVGTATFPDEKYFLTEVYTALAGDEQPDNDMASVESRTAPGLGDIIFEMDVETPSGDLRCLGVEFDGTYFYVTGGGDYYTYSYVHVLDTMGNLICQPLQPNWCLYGWGLRDLADDGEHFNGSMTYYVDQFDVDVPMGALTYTSSFPGPCAVQRALAYDPEHDVYFTGDFSDYVYKWNKEWTVFEYNTNADLYAMYGAAYDTDYDEGGWVWWHSQDGPDPWYLLQIEQMDAATMTFTDVIVNYEPTITTGIAGGMCFYEGFRGYDVLFTLVQGDVVDAIVGIIVRPHIPVADATIYFAPTTLNLGSQGTWVKCYVELEEGYDVYDIDPSTVRIEKIDGESAVLYCDGTGEVGDWDSDGILELQLKFDRGDLVDAMEGIVIPPAYVELYVRGDLTDADFGGSATIRVINPQTKHDGYMSAGDIPVAFALSEVCPNPFSSKTVIRYALPTPSQVNLTIYDVNGRAVKGLVNNAVGVGYHSVQWDGRDDSGRTVASGVYFLKLEAADYKTTTKLLFLR